MAKTQETVTEVGDAAEGVEAPGRVQRAAGTVGETTKGAAGQLVGVLTSGFLIAAAAGFVVGVALGFAAARSTTPPPPPRWQVWR